LKLLEENERSPVVQKTKGWLSAASSSFGNMFSKATKASIDNVLPGIKNLLASTDEELDNGDLQVKKYSEKLEVLKQSFLDLYKLASNLHANRSTECKIERAFQNGLDNFISVSNDSLKKTVDRNAVISKIRGNEAYSNLVSVQELLYATESHLVWIESVQDLIQRKNDLCEKLSNIKTEMKNSPLNHHEIESCKYLLNLTERRDKIIKGIRKEMDQLAIGTRDFYPRYISSGFIQSQTEFYTKNTNLYQN
jgi:hypothetical protein